jgi:RimJ/RimL family protein N-acetyltransferase
MTEHAHHSLGLRRVILEIEADNLPSITVARAAGFVLTDASTCGTRSGGSGSQ